jgi:hypothetical protein
LGIKRLAQTLGSEIYRGFIIAVDAMKHMIRILTQKNNDMNLWSNLIVWIAPFVAYVSQPRIAFRIKTSIMISSLVFLLIVILLSYQKQLAELTKRPSQLEVLQSQLDEDGCSALGCLIDKKFYAELKSMESKQMNNGNDNLVLSLNSQLEQLSAKFESLQMQLDMKQAILDQSIQDAIVSVESKLSAEIEDKLLHSPSIDFSLLYGPDYSLGSAGAYINLARTSPSFYQRHILDKLFNNPSSAGPELVLTQSLDPGNCWGMKGVLKLYNVRYLWAS